MLIDNKLQKEWGSDSCTDKDAQTARSVPCARRECCSQGWIVVDRLYDSGPGATTETANTLLSPGQVCPILSKVHSIWLSIPAVHGRGCGCVGMDVLVGVNSVRVFVCMYGMDKEKCQKICYFCPAVGQFYTKRLQGEFHKERRDGITMPKQDGNPFKDLAGTKEGVAKGW